MPAIKISKKTNTPIVLYCLDIWPESIVGKVKKDSLIFKIVKKISLNIYNSSNLILVTSNSFSKYLSDIGVSTRMIYLPQHSSDLPYLNKEKVIENNVINFLFAGNIGYSQNLCTVIDAFSKVKYDNYIFNIVGDGSAFETLKRKIIDLKLESKCITYGRKNKEELIPMAWGLSKKNSEKPTIAFKGVRIS